MEKRDRVHVTKTNLLKQAMSSCSHCDCECARDPNLCICCGETVPFKQRFSYKGSLWHKDCFTCMRDDCNQNLAGVPFEEICGLQYCTSCYNKLMRYGSGPKEKDPHEIKNPQPIHQETVSSSHPIEPVPSPGVADSGFAPDVSSAPHQSFVPFKYCNSCGSKNKAQDTNCENCGKSFTPMGHSKHIQVEKSDVSPSPETQSPTRTTGLMDKVYSDPDRAHVHESGEYDQ